ncbi:MAG: HAMP domain-containing histidine kinase [Betaproteobacteria bacterium]|nr:HAMP domain-containing histidine kinase [Betaproteobacteria bacterium]
MRYKIPLRGSLLVLVTAAAVTLSLMFREYDQLRDDLIASSASMGRVLAKTLVTPLVHDDVWRAFEIINSPFHASGHELAPQTAEIVTVLDSRGMVYVSTQPTQYPILADPMRTNRDFSELQHAIDHYREFEPTVVEPLRSDKLYVVAPIVSDGVQLGSLVIGYSKSAFAPRFYAIAKRAGVVTLFVIAVLLPASWYWGQRFARPLMNLARSMEQVSTRIPAEAEVRVEESRDEMGQVGAAYKAMLQELREKELLKREIVVSERLAAVGRLSAGIAHEINNPLGGMLNAINTFKHHGSDDPVTVKTLSLLERGLLQIRDTVAALLVEARIESHPLTRQDIEDTRTLVLADANGKSVRFEWENDVVGALQIPSTLVRQILINLMLNAVDAAGANGVASGHVYHDSRDLHIVVANNGTHIPPERMEYLFEPFSSHRAGGHGLGLWVTYQVIRQLSGDVAVASEPDHTSFHVTLPLETQPA